MRLENLCKGRTPTGDRTFNGRRRRRRRYRGGNLFSWALFWCHRKSWRSS